MRVLICSIALVALTTYGVDARAQSLSQTTNWEASGSQLCSVYRAWRALQAQYEPNAQLSDFRVGYTERVGEPPTVSFLKRPTTTPLPNGVVRVEPATTLYLVVLEGDQISITVSPN